MGRLLAWAQGVYYAITGIWALVDIDSFQAVTGPKNDLWLVRTVGVLVLVIGAAIFLAGVRGTPTLEIAFLAAASALGLAAIDIIYVTADVISGIYLLDAGAELLLAGLWIANAWASRRVAA
jgi:hypothetical protein